MAPQDASVALAHDYLLVLRGAERTFAEMAEVWPAASISTLLYDEAGTAGVFAGRDVRTSVLQRLGVDQGSSRTSRPLSPELAKRPPLPAHQLVVSSSSASAHAVRPAPGAKHVTYCHSPFRYAWHEQARALAEVPAVARPALRLALARHRR